jgi:hypothetical protein
MKESVSELLNIGMDLLTPNALAGRRWRKSLRKTHGSNR